jgi:mycothiol synthase
MDMYKLRAYKPSDAQAVTEVINTCAMETVGFPRAVVDSVGNLWAYRFVPFSSEKVVAVDQSNEVVGYAYFKSEDDYIVAETGGSVRPDHWGKGVGTALVEWAAARARESTLQAPQGIEAVLQTSLYEQERESVKLFKDCGYTSVREWVHLVLEMDQPPIVPSIAPQLTLREMDLDHDWEIVGPAMEEVYADHWGAIPPDSYEKIEQELETDESDDELEIPEDTSYSNAPGFCFIVLDGDTVAGGILCNARLVERADTGRVGSMFVRPRYRRQGIARTLMLAAFDAFWKNGLRRVITDTDAKSFSNAPKLYTGLGMRPYRREFTYEKEIRPGREVRLLR